MVLRLKAWESRSPPGLQSRLALRDRGFINLFTIASNIYAAGWSSLVARQAHNLKVVGSNPTPATKISPLSQRLSGLIDSPITHPMNSMDSLWTQEGASFCVIPIVQSIGQQDLGGGSPISQCGPPKLIGLAVRFLDRNQRYFVSMLKSPRQMGRNEDIFDESETLHVY